MAGNQLGQQCNLFAAARLSNGKADTARTGVDLGQQCGDARQALLGAGDAAGIQIFAKRVADQTDGLHGIACIPLQCIGQAVALAFGLAQNLLPLLRVTRQIDEGGDGADTDQRVQACRGHSEKRRKLLPIVSERLRLRHHPCGMNWLLLFE